MKIFLANPPLKYPLGRGYEKYYIRAGSRWPHSGVKRAGSLPHYLPFPFFLAYAAALLKKNGFDVEAADGIALNLSGEDFFALIKSARPDAVFFEVTTPTIKQDLALARRIRDDCGAAVIFGGTHATTHFNEILSSENAPDFVLRGEYEFVLSDLVRALAEGKNPAGVKGVCFVSGGAVIDGGKSVPIEPLDSLPYPAYEMFPSSSVSLPGGCSNRDIGVYWDGFCQRRPAIQMHASRGCPYGCYFCLWPQVMYGSRRYRKFSASRVVEEMGYVVKKFSPREIYFDDDDFTIDAAHVRAVCAGISAAGLKVKWSCMGDAINLDEDLIDRMAAAGCIGIKFGVESASPALLEKIGKPVDLGKVSRVAAACASRGIKTHATFSVGLIGETEATVRETLDFARTLDVDSIQVSVCTPYPGTGFYDWAQKSGFLENDLEWSDFDGTSRGVMKLPGMPRERLEALRSGFFRSWLIKKMTSPRWLIRQVRNFARALSGQGPAFFLGKLIWGISNGLNLARGWRKK